MARARQPRRTHRTRITAALAAALLPLTVALTAPAAHADEIPANGNFTFTTGPGILPAWDSAGVSLVGVSPGSVITNRITNTARVNLPVISKSGTANATAGGFRFVNTESGESFRCSVPVVDTRARVIDCVLPSGYNAAVFEISSIDERTKVNTATTKTTIFQGMELRIINREMANRLNDELDTSVFSASVVLGSGSLIVSRAR
jgi:hypothetical protein